jgi:hypothetical protein
MEITIYILNRFVAFVTKRSAIAVVGVGENKLIAVTRERRYPINDEASRNNPVIVNLLVGYQGMKQLCFQMAAFCIFAFKRRAQIPKIGAVIFYMKGERLFLQTVMKPPLLPALYHRIAKGIFSVLTSKVS